MLRLAVGLSGRLSSLCGLWVRSFIPGHRACTAPCCVPPGGRLLLGKVSIRWNLLEFGTTTPTHFVSARCCFSLTVPVIIVVQRVDVLRRVCAGFRVFRLGHDNSVLCRSLHISWRMVVRSRPWSVCKNQSRCHLSVNWLVWAWGTVYYGSGSFTWMSIKKSQSNLGWAASPPLTVENSPQSPHWLQWDAPHLPPKLPFDDFHPI